MTKRRTQTSRAVHDAFVRQYVSSVEKRLDDGVREDATRAYRVLVEYLNTDQGRDVSPTIREHMRELVANTILGRLCDDVAQIAGFRRIAEDFEEWATARVDGGLMGDDLPPRLASQLAGFDADGRAFVRGELIKLGVKHYASWLMRVDTLARQVTWRGARA
jgi:hypothetical protein